MSTRSQFLGSVLLLALSLALPASSQVCPAYLYLNVAYSGTNCNSVSGSSSGPCALNSPVTFTLMTSSGTPYVLQSCETGVVWTFSDGGTATGNPVQHTFTTSATNAYASARVTYGGGTSYNGGYAYLTAANGIVKLITPTTGFSETAGTAEVTVQTTYAPMTVEYYTSDPYGNAGTRYQATSGTLSFAAGETTKKISIPIINDNTFGGTAAFTVYLRNATGGVLIWDPYYGATVNIIDDDPPPTVDLAGTWPATIPENIGTWNVEVRRTGDMTRAFAVYYYGPNGSGSVAFAANETSKTISFPIQHDNVWQPARSGSIELMSPSNGAVIAGAPYGYKYFPYTIVDDSPAPTITIGNVTAVEGNSGTKTFTFPVTLSQATPSGFSFTLTTKDGTATAGSDYTAASNSYYLSNTTPQTFAVTVKGDTAIEQDETFTVTGSIPSYYPEYQGIRIISGTGTILNDDYGMPSIKLAAGTRGHITMQLGNIPSSADTVTLTSSKPSVATVPPSFNLTPGGAAQSFEVNAVANGVTTVTAQLPPSMGGAALQSTVQVYTPATLTATPEFLTLTTGTTGEVKLTFSPTPASPLQLPVSTSSSALQVPQSVTIDTSGNGTFTVKGLTAGDGTVTIQQPDANGGFVETVLVHVGAPPAGLFIANIAPPNGPTAGGTQVAITGQNFTSSCTVSFDGTGAASTTFGSATSLTATTPAHAAGTVDVTVTCGSDKYTLANSFTYTAASAQLTALSPAFGSTRGGTVVSLTGTNMRSSCGVLFGGVAAKVVSDLTPDKLIVSTPARTSADTVDVTLRCGTTDATLRNAFSYTTSDDPSAVIADVDPLAAAAGQSVTLTGVRFRPTDAVSFDDTRAAITATTPTTQLVTVPAVNPGRVAITLRDAEGHTTTTGPIFTVLEPVTPEITSVLPAKVAAGGELTITGKGFRSPYTFLLGTTSAGAIVDMTFNRAVVRVPATFAVGTYTLGIANGAGNLAAIGPRVEVAGAFTLSSAAPQCGSSAGGTKITITGTGFASGARVWFGGAESSNVNVISSTKIEATAPEGHLGWAVVRVANPNGDADTLSRAFFYYSPFETSGCSTPARSRGARH